jgi:hypothetical protein
MFLHVAASTIHSLVAEMEIVGFLEGHQNVALSEDGPRPAVSALAWSQAVGLPAAVILTRGRTKASSRSCVTGPLTLFRI